MNNEDIFDRLLKQCDIDYAKYDDDKKVDVSAAAETFKYDEVVSVVALPVQSVEHDVVADYSLAKADLQRIYQLVRGHDTFPTYHMYVDGLVQRPVYSSVVDIRCLITDLSVVQQYLSHPVNQVNDYVLVRVRDTSVVGFGTASRRKTAENMAAYNAIQKLKLYGLYDKYDRRVINSYEICAQGGNIISTFNMLYMNIYHYNPDFKYSCKSGVFTCRVWAFGAYVEGTGSSKQKACAACSQRCVTAYLDGAYDVSDVMTKSRVKSDYNDRVRRSKQKTNNDDDETGETIVYLKQLRREERKR